MSMKGIPPRYDSASWEAEQDANTLAEAEIIKSDKTRMEKAQDAAKVMSQRKQEEANKMAKIASSKMAYDRSPKPPQKGESGG